MQTIDYVIRTLETLVNIPSPSGYTENAARFVEAEAGNFGYTVERTKKGGLIITVAGESSHVLGLSAHIDTLGAMVRSIASDGKLNIFPIGGYMMESVEGSYCGIHTRNGKNYTGTILTKQPSVHTYDDARTLPRKQANMEVRIDEEVETKEDVLKLGINTGDFISFDPRFDYTQSGYIKSRHLDNKASVAVLLGLLKEIHDSGSKPQKTLKILISNYEEIGHGASYIPEEIEEFLAVDMGALGGDLSGSEHKVSICAMDSSGPYDFDMTNALIEIAKQNDIDFAVDIFPHYGSDASAALRGGNNIRCALIGQGVHASHHMERTHRSGLENTLKLVKAYVYHK